MTAPYRTSEASLRAEVERLTRALAVATARRRWRWRVHPAGVGGIVGSIVGIVGSIVGVTWSVLTGDHSTLSQRAALGAASVAGTAVLWALLFVRREPAPSDDGGGR